MVMAIFGLYWSSKDGELNIKGNDQLTSPSVLLKEIWFFDIIFSNNLLKQVHKLRFNE